MVEASGHPEGEGKAEGAEGEGKGDALAEFASNNRCELTGRPRAYYRKLKLSRIMLRELGSFGQIPGMVKSSW